MKRFDPWKCASALFLVYLFWRAGFRAATQGMTADEAFHYGFFLRGSIADVFTAPYNVSNHVLHTALCWLSIHWFGLAELSFRVPTLAGAVLFFAAVYRLASKLFGGGFLHLIATLSLAGNPYVLDFFTVARGYGLALAFLSLAMLAAIDALRPGGVDPGGLFRAGVWSALSVASNLAFLFPVAGLLLAVLVILQRHPGAADRASVTFAFLDSMGGPFLVFSFVILVIPLRTVTREAFYMGVERWHETIAILVGASLAHDGQNPLLSNWPALLRYVCEKATATYVPLLAGAIAAVTVLLLVRTARNPAPLLAGLTLSLTIGLLGAAHVGAHVKLPVMRTSVYFLLLFPLALLSFLSGEKGSAARRAGWCFLPVIAFLLLLYVPQTWAKATFDWRYDASTRQFAETIESIRMRNGVNAIRVGGSWVFEPTLNFYRVKNHYDGWQPVVRGKPTDPADFYVLSKEDRGAVNALQLRVLADDPISQSILAVPAEASAR